MAKKPGTKVKKEKAQPSSTNNEGEEMEGLAASEAGGVVDTIEKHRLVLISSAVAVFGLLCLFLVGKQLGNERDTKAALAYTDAATKRDIAALDQVVVDFPGTKPAGNALLTKADVQIDTGKLQDAISTLTTMANEYSSHPQHAQVYFMLANLYQKSGDIPKAEENFQKVLELQPDGELSPITRIRMGDLELAKGDADKARQYYDDSLAKHPGNPFIPLMDMRNSQINLTMPKEIDKPKSAEPEPAPAPATPAVPEQPEEVKAEVEIEE